MLNNNIRRTFVPLAVYTVIALVITYPLTTRFDTYVGGFGFGDSFEYLRLGWWGRYALQNGLNPFYQSLFAYPDGFFSATQWAQPLIYWPITLFGFFLNPVAAFNLWLLLLIVLSGMSAYILCRDLGLPTLPALVGGLIFTAYPAVQGHLSVGHVNPLSNYALPLVVLCLHRIIYREGGPRVAVAGAVALLILALGNFTFAVFGLLPILLFGGLYLLLTDRARIRGVVLRNLLLMLVGGVVLIAPFYLPLIAEALSPQRPAYLQETGQVRYSADLLSFIAPSPFTLWGRNLAPGYSQAVLGTNSAEGTAYVGLAATALTVIALIRQRRRVAHWFVIALGCLVFSLGPLLKLGDRPVAYSTDGYQGYIVMPWGLLQDLPLINVTRTPGRFNMTAGLMFGVLAAYGLAALLDRIRPNALRIGLTAVLCGFVLFEYQLFFPFATEDATLPDYFYALAGRNDVRAVLDVPYDDPVAQKRALLQQTAHHKPLIGGYVSRRTPVEDEKLRLLNDAALGRAQTFTPTGQAARLTAGAAWVMLRANGVDVLVVHWAGWNEARRAAYLEFAGPSTFQDDNVAVYERTDRANAALSLLPFVLNNNKIYLWAASPIDRRFDIELSGTGTDPVRLIIGGKTVRAWADTQPFTFWQRLEPGFHNLRLESGGLTLSSVTTSNDPVMTFQPFRVSLGEAMALLGFRAPDEARPGDRLVVDTMWHNAQPLAGDYHLFVHLIDAAGVLAAQDDIVPGRGAFPTSAWAPPQDWAQTAILSLPTDLPPGTYSLYAGWYRYPNLARLPVSGEGRGAKDGLVFLGEISVR